MSDPFLPEVGGRDAAAPFRKDTVPFWLILSEGVWYNAVLIFERNGGQYVCSPDTRWRKGGRDDVPEH